MLKTRILTAVFLLILLLTVFMLPHREPAFILLGLIVVVAAWEWLRLCRMHQSVYSGVLLLGIILVFWAQRQLFIFTKLELFGILLSQAQVYYLLVTILWLSMIVPIFWLDRRAAALGWAQSPVYGIELVQRLGFALFGLILLFSAFSALLGAYQHGLIFMFSLIASIWVADSVAYFVGRQFGKHKLAPNISPGKTWEGALAGVIGGTLWHVCMLYLPGSFSTVLYKNLGLLTTLAIASCVVIISITGDLFESTVKRRSGVKDSSQLLPGHGGILDRIDALIPALPFAMLWISS